jgi:hypothetical protein
MYSLRSDEVVVHNKGYHFDYKQVQAIPNLLPKAREGLPSSFLMMRIALEGARI